MNWATCPSNKTSSNNQIIFYVIIFFLIIKGIVWSIATPLWHGPDEYAHFIYAKIVAERGEFPTRDDKSISIPVFKSIALAKFNTYAHDAERKWTPYDGRYAPFEESLDAPITEDEAEKLFYQLSTWDLQLITFAWTPHEPVVTDKSVSFQTYQMKFLPFDIKSKSFILYAWRFIGASPAKQIVRRSPGFLYSNDELVKTLFKKERRDESIDDAFIKDGIITFKKAPDETIEFKVVPIDHGSLKIYPHTYTYPPLYYFCIAAIIKTVGFFGGGILSEIFFSRLFSTLLCMIAVYFVYRSFKFLWPKNEEYALAGIALFALWPMNAYIFSLITPDNMLNMFCAAAFYYIIRIINGEEAEKKNWIYFSITAAAAAFCKINGALLIVIWWNLLILLIFYKTHKLCAIALLPPVLMLLAPYMLWYSRSGLGEFVGHGLNLTLKEYINNYLGFSQHDLFNSIAGNFGSLRSPMPEFIYKTLIVFIAVILLYFIRGLVRGFKNGSKLNYLYLFTCTLFSALFFFVMEYLKIKELGFVLQGRYFFFLALPVVVMAWGAGVDQSSRKMRLSGIILVYLFVIAVIFIHGYALINYIAQNFF